MLSLEEQNMKLVRIETEEHCRIARSVWKGIFGGTTWIAIEKFVLNELYTVEYQQSRPSQPYFLIYDKQTVIGISGLYTHGNNVYYLGWFGIIGWIQRQGYGSQALKLTMNRLRKLTGGKAKNLYLWTEGDEPVLQFYRKNGFVEYKKKERKMRYFKGAL